MEDLTLFDGVVAAIILISGVLAYSRGITREIMSIAGWIGAAVVAFYFAPQAEPFVREIPVISDLVGENCELGILTAFAGVFVVALIIIALFTPLISGAIQKSALSPVDSGLGFLFGLVRGVVLIIAVLIVYDFFVAGGEGYPMVADSKTVELLSEQQQSFAEYIPTSITELPDWVIEPYNTLMADCPGEPIPTDEAAVPDATEGTEETNN